MSQKIKTLIVCLLIIFLGYGFYKYYNLYQEAQRSYEKAQVLCDSIKSEKESVIDSLYLEIDAKESLIDSLFSNRDTIIINRVIMKEKIQKLPLEDNVKLLEYYLSL